MDGTMCVYVQKEGAEVREAVEDGMLRIRP